MTGLLGPATERARLVEADDVQVARGFEALVSSLPLAGRALAAAADGELRAVEDGNRALILPDVTVDHGGRTWFVAAKGVGALTPMYGELLAGREVRSFQGETWFGEAPWGGQGEGNAARGLEVTSLAGGAVWNGFHLCPVVQVVRVPESLVRRDDWWYRRFRGPVLQEHRLVPSDVRLFHASERTLGQAPDAVLGAFGVTSAADADAFVERLLRTGLAALTLWIRTAREVPWGLHGLAYVNVWLDKDSVVAPDGALFFADLEGLDWTLAGADWSVDERVREQLEHNLYELLYAVDVVLRAGERLAGRARSPAERRRSLAERIALAVDGDPWCRPEPGPDGLDVVISTPLRPDEPVRVRLVDTR
jgi:hypothetical protein